MEEPMDKTKTPICPRCFCPIDIEVKRCEKCNYTYESDNKVIYKEDFVC